MAPRSITRQTLRFILEVARESHPKEFAALLENHGGTIDNLIFLPGTRGSDGSADLPLHNLPLGVRVAGSVHSHPVEDRTPSDEDLKLFSDTGEVHIIVCPPYTESSWSCYTWEGTPARLRVVRGP
ncbi:MAG: Mov34/MPN/PAD-1 family protein [Euryarchaeota archaeon]|nr:Mov34/MPN/PAD-1 family protein [Euryarchaeota archaeon]